MLPNYLSLLTQPYCIPLADTILEVGLTFYSRLPRFVVKTNPGQSIQEKVERSSCTHKCAPISLHISPVCVLKSTSITCSLCLKGVGNVKSISAFTAEIVEMEFRDL